MIKTPVRKGIWNEMWPIIDATGRARLHTYFEENADQIVTALNAQQPKTESVRAFPFDKKEHRRTIPCDDPPKCETCGGSGLIRLPDSPTTGRTGLCPRCKGTGLQQPAKQTGELARLRSLEKEYSLIITLFQKEPLSEEGRSLANRLLEDINSKNLSFYIHALESKNQQAAARIEVLEKACYLALHNEGKRWSEIRPVLQAALIEETK